MTSILLGLLVEGFAPGCKCKSLGEAGEVQRGEKQSTAPCDFVHLQGEALLEQ